jgi:hypothetical protein
MATITVRNVGRVDRFLPDWPPNWGGPFSPHVRMRTAAGRLVYQEELSTFLTPTPGSAPTTYILRPGRSLTRHVRFVLQAGRVQAVDRVADGYIALSSGPGTSPPPRFKWASHVWKVTSPFLSVSLTGESPPAVRVVRRGGIVVAIFTPPRVAIGRPFYMDSTYCSTGPSGGWSSQHLPWTIAPHNWISVPVYPYCKQRQWWHAVIGWPDHAVAFVRYVRH